MCQLSCDGGRRCPDYDRLKASTAADFAPEHREDVPDVVWAQDDLSDLWNDEADTRSATCAGLLTLEDIKPREPENTSSVMAVAEKAGASCSGLEYRVKSPHSLSRKIRTEQEEAAAQHSEHQQSPEQIAAGMKDITRYTITHADHDQVAPTAEKTVTELQAQGWQISQIKNSYHDGNSYKGLAIIGTAPNGATSEFQIHSEHSLAVKEQSHLPYEIYRDPHQPPKKRLEAKAECQRLATQVPTPKGLDKLTHIGGVPVSQRRYT